MRKQDLEKGWGALGFAVQATEGSDNNWRLEFYYKDELSQEDFRSPYSVVDPVAIFLIRHTGETVEFIDLQVYEGGLDFSGLLSYYLPDFYEPMGFKEFVIPRAKGVAADLFERIGYKRNDEGGLSAKLYEIKESAKAYLDERKIK